MARLRMKLTEGAAIFVILLLRAASAIAADTDKAPEPKASETYTTGAWLICIGSPQKDQDRIANCTEALGDEKIVGIERAWAL